MFFDKFVEIGIFKMTCYLKRYTNDDTSIETSGGIYIISSDNGTKVNDFTLNIPFYENLDYFRGKMDWKELKNTTITFWDDDTAHTYDLDDHQI